MWDRVDKLSLTAIQTRQNLDLVGPKWIRVKVFHEDEDADRHTLAVSPTSDKG
ncbi:hypothetical protein PF003_g37170 [Phytophthora fragariae]|nr:hypothetical protein PF003_g37170 [Phytophthora fragariae]